MRLKRLHIAVLLLVATALPSVCLAGEEAFEKFQPRIVNLGGRNLVERLERAEAFANKAIEKYLPDVKAKVPNAYGSKENPFVFIHIGDEVPEQLQWIQVHLVQAGLTVDPMIIKNIEIADQMDYQRKVAPDDTYTLNYNEHPLKQLSPKSIALNEMLDKTWVRANIMRRWITGMPNGLTYYPEPPRTKDRKKLDAKLATLTASLGAVTASVSLYVTELTTEHKVRILPAVAFVSAWAWFSTYYEEWMYKNLGQSQWLKRDNIGNYGVKPGSTVTVARDLVISSLINGIFWVCAFGGDSILTGAFWATNSINTLLAMSAGYPISLWLSEHKPSTTEDGTFEPDKTKGQWSERKWLATNIAIYLAWRMSKNMHSLGISFMDPVYKAFSVLYTAMMARHERYALADTLKRAMRRVRGRDIDYCETTLMVPKKTLLQE